MSSDALSWMCRACKETRPDAWISVAKRKIVVDRGEPIELNACYCNDRPRCFLEMSRILDAMARPFIDGLTAPRVHILRHGAAICDPHKRFPEDFPQGTEWIGRSQSILDECFIVGGFAGKDAAAALAFPEVTCEACRECAARFDGRSSSSPEPR